MGCDIHPFAEIRQNGAWHLNTRKVFRNAYADCDEEPFTDKPFNWRGYGMFGLLARVRDYDVTPICEPRGLPDDVSPEVDSALEGRSLREPRGYFDVPSLHSHSWLTLAELQAIDPQRPYDGCTGAEPLADYLGEGFFEQVAELAQLGDPDDVRIVFAFGS